MRGWYIGCALAFQARERSSILLPRSFVFASLVKWYNETLPMSSSRFDSDMLHSRHSSMVERRKIDFALFVCEIAEC